MIQLSNTRRISLGILMFLAVSTPVARATRPPPNPVPFIEALSPISVAPGPADGNTDLEVANWGSNVRPTSLRHQSGTGLDLTRARKHFAFRRYSISVILWRT